MNIWQWILVMLPVFRLGASVHDDVIIKPKTAGKIISNFLWFAMSEFVLFKAGVLIIDLW